MFIPVTPERMRPLDSLFLRASRQGIVPIVRTALAAGADLETRTIWGSTPLILAAIYGRLEVAKLLLCAGANIDAPCEGGCTPLMFAICYRRLDLVKLFLKFGANPNVKDRDGETALALALRRDTEIVNLLREAGAK